MGIDSQRIHLRNALVLGHIQGVCDLNVLLGIAVHTGSAHGHRQNGERKAPSMRRIAARARQLVIAGPLQLHDVVSSEISGCSFRGTRVARILSMVLPSMSTTSSFQPSHSTLSVTLGRVPVSSITMPLRVW